MREPSSDLDFGPTVRSFASGQRLFGRFVLVRVLGRGGMGVVWLAQDEQLERPVALKFLPDTLNNDPSALDDLKRETRKSLQLTHHHIVRIYDFHRDDVAAAISMEYIDGDTLANLRLERPSRLFEASELALWISDLCAALQYAHVTARVVHRDLKPSNLMLNRGNELKITDFGISSSISESITRLSMRSSSGTLVYMSPQHLDGQLPTPADDIYALGATLYDLLTTRPPFYQGNIDRQIRENAPMSIAQRRSQLELTGAAVPDAWEQTIAACLAKEPGARPKNPEEVAMRLGGVPFTRPSSQRLTPPPASAPPVSTPLTADLPRRPISGPILAAICACLAVGVGAAYLWWPRSGPKIETIEGPSLSATPTPISVSPQPPATVPIPIPTPALPTPPLQASAPNYLAEGTAARQRGDTRRAVEMFKQAGLAGAAAIREIAISYATGTGGAPDEKRAAELFQIASEQGDAEAQYDLALLSLHGSGATRDPSRGRSLLESAAQKGSARAKNALGVMYERGLDGGPADLQKAVSYYRAAAEQNLPIAEHNLAVCYDKGKGAQRDIDKARKLYEQASADGCGKATNNLAVMYAEGDGGKQDEQKARELFEKAAERGDDVAQANLGLLYEYGHGVPHNLLKAQEFYRKSAAQGNADAESGLKRTMGQSNTGKRPVTRPWGHHEFPYLQAPTGE